MALTLAQVKEAYQAQSGILRSTFTVWQYILYLIYSNGASGNSTNASRGYALITISDSVDGTAFLVVINAWKTANPTFIPLSMEVITLDKDYLLINYTT